MTLILNRVELTEKVAGSLLLPAFSGRLQDIYDGEYWSGNIRLIRVSSGLLTAIGCDSPVHGVHHRFSSMVDVLVLKYPGVIFDQRADKPLCTKCEGSGWVQHDQPAFHEIIKSAIAIGMYRGVAFTKKRKNDEGTSDLF